MLDAGNWGNRLMVGCRNETTGLVANCDVVAVNPPVETTSTKWRDTLRQAAAHLIVSKKPSPLFWFASSEDLTVPVPEGKKTVPRYLAQPEVIFSRLWHGCVDNNAFNLAD